MGKSRKTGNIRLSDVAAHIGVSAITVSRALREPEKVSGELRARIHKAIGQLGYVPDPAARALASGRTNVIGVIIPSVTNYVFSDVLRSIYDEVDQTSYNLQLGNTRYSPLEEEKVLTVFLSQKPAGLIVAGLDQSAAGRNLLSSAPCPIVQIMDSDGDPVDMVVGISHVEAARAATRHMIECGYRKLAFLGARMDPRSQKRFRGFRDAAEEGGVFSDIRVVTTPQPSSVTRGTELFGELMSRAPETDAVLCNNDDLAIGVLFETQRRLIRVPQQLGICGFNDFEMAAAAEPPLTSVKTFREEMGRRAITMLISAIEGNRPDPPNVDLGFEIMCRRSTMLPG